MKLSIVATLYQSAPYIKEFYERASLASKQLAAEDYEIILVNDGSPDNSLGLAVLLTESDPNVTVIDLSRNFGHHKAMMTGLMHSRGDLIFLIDSDLEEEPEWLLDFAKVRDSEEADVVYGRQRSRKGKLLERWSGQIYYLTLKWLCNIDHPVNIVTARLMSRRYVNALLRFREREMVISCLWVITGFKQSEVLVNKHSTSKTTYSFVSKLASFSNVVTSFSTFPLKLVFYLGVILFIVSLVYSSFLLINRLFLAQPVDGWTSVMVSVWMLGGLVISFIGIIGIYLSKVYTESKQRPYTIVRQIYGQ